MRPEMLAKLRATMRGNAQKAIGTGGTLEPLPFHPPVPTRSNTAFQQDRQKRLTEFSGVPTVPTQFCREKKRPANDDVSASEPRSVGRALLPDDEEVAGTDIAFWQGVADERNGAEARRETTARYCRCRNFASTAWMVDGRDVWACDEHSPPDGFDRLASRQRDIFGRPIKRG